MGQFNEWLSNSIFEIGIGTLWNLLNAFTVLLNGKVGIWTTTPSALLTVEGAIRPIKVDYNPCGNSADYPEWAMFYNSTNHYYCFCDGTGSAKKIADETISCF